MICIYCGKEIEDNVRYCNFCGAVYNNLEYPEPDDAQQDETETVIEDTGSAEMADAKTDTEELTPEESNEELKKEIHRDVFSAAALAIGGILLLRRLFRKR